MLKLGKIPSFAEQAKPAWVDLARCFHVCSIYARIVLDFFAALEKAK